MGRTISLKNKKLEKKTINQNSELFLFVIFNLISDICKSILRGVYM